MSVDISAAQAIGVAFGAAMREVQAKKVEAHTKVCGRLKITVGDNSLLTGEVDIAVVTNPEIDITGKND